jgi:hypothetical protein
MPRLQYYMEIALRVNMKTICKMSSIRLQWHILLHMFTTEKTFNIYFSSKQKYALHEKNKALDQDHQWTIL